MGTLKDILNGFENQIKGITKEEELQKIFKDSLAPAFLYGGYIEVHKEFRVYIRTVEFYFHCEKENGIHDPIVYHRNDRCIVGEVPYFPMMSLHAHDSGFDITFESEAGKYRASALIRAYEVIRIQDGKPLVWYTKENKFVEAERNKEGKYVVWDSKDQKKVEIHRIYNTQSTYLKKLLNGFPLGIENGIKWVDWPKVQTKDISEDTRQNVFQSESEFVYKKIAGRICDRKWSFTRKEEI